MKLSKKKQKEWWKTEHSQAGSDEITQFKNGKWSLLEKKKALLFMRFFYVLYLSHTFLKLTECESGADRYCYGFMGEVLCCVFFFKGSMYVVFFLIYILR